MLRLRRSCVCVALGGGAPRPRLLTSIGPPGARGYRTPVVPRSTRGSAASASKVGPKPPSKAAASKAASKAVTAIPKSGVGRPPRQPDPTLQSAEERKTYQKQYYKEHRDSLIARNRNNRQSKAQLERAGVFAAKQPGRPKLKRADVDDDEEVLTPEEIQARSVARNVARFVLRVLFCALCFVVGRV